MLTDDIEDADKFNGDHKTAYNDAWWMLVLLVGVVFGFAMVCFLPHEVADEGFHAPQVWTFFSGTLKVAPQLTMPPTYHLLLAAMMRCFGFFSVDMLRFLSAIVALTGLPLMYALIKHYWPDEAKVRTLQWFFMPIVFPFFFLIYTDAWALLPLLGMLLFTLRRRHLLAGLCGLLAVSFRQTAIPWVMFAGLMAVLETTSDTGIFTRIVASLRRSWPYLVVVAMFMVFVVLNKGVALGDRSQQQMAFHITNLYFFLIMAWVLLLPYNLSQLPTIVRWLKRPVVLILLVLGMFVFLATYSNPHQYNQPGLNFYLRNRLLNLMVESIAWRAIFYVPVAWMTLSLLTARLPESRLRWVFPVIALSLCLHPLIDIRYYLPALAIILAWREPCRPGWELATIYVYVLTTVYLIFHIARTSFFL